MESDKPLSEIALFVRAARAALKMSQDRLADIYGKTKGNVSAWENDRHEPSFAIIEDLSQRSKVPMPSSAPGTVHLLKPNSGPRLVRGTFSNPSEEFSDSDRMIELLALWQASDAPGREFILESARSASKRIDSRWVRTADKI